MRGTRTANHVLLPLSFAQAPSLESREMSRRLSDMEGKLLAAQARLGSTSGKAPSAGDADFKLRAAQVRLPYLPT